MQAGELCHQVPPPFLCSLHACRSTVSCMFIFLFSMESSVSQNACHIGSSGHKKRNRRPIPGISLLFLITRQRIPHTISSRKKQNSSQKRKNPRQISLAGDLAILIKFTRSLTAPCCKGLQLLPGCKAIGPQSYQD